MSQVENTELTIGLFFLLILIINVYLVNVFGKKKIHLSLNTKILVFTLLTYFQYLLVIIFYYLLEALNMGDKIQSYLIAYIYVIGLFISLPFFLYWIICMIFYWVKARQN